MNLEVNPGSSVVAASAGYAVLAIHLKAQKMVLGGNTWIPTTHGLKCALATFDSRCEALEES